MDEKALERAMAHVNDLTEKKTVGIFKKMIFEKKKKKDPTARGIYGGNSAGNRQLRQLDKEKY